MLFFIFSLIVYFEIIVSVYCGRRVFVEQKNYEGVDENDLGTKIIQTKDGSMYILGQIRDGANKNVLLEKISSEGATQFSRKMKNTQTPRYIEPLSEGGFAIIGVTSDFPPQDCFLAKFDGDGEIVWFKTFAGDNDSPYFLKETYGGDLVVAGYSYSTGEGGKSHSFITRFNSDGEMLWSTIVDISGGDLGVVSASDYSNGGTIEGFVVLAREDGEFLDATDNEIAVIAFDGNGLPLWSKGYGVKDRDLTPCYIHETDDHSLVFTGNQVYPPNYNLFFIKTDHEGTITHARTFGTMTQDVVTGYSVTPDGGFLGAARLQSGLGKLMHLKLFSNGSVDWMLYYNDPNLNTARDSIYIQEQQGLFSVGSYLSFNTDILVTRVNYDIETNEFFWGDCEWEFYEEYLEEDLVGLYEIDVTINITTPIVNWNETMLNHTIIIEDNIVEFDILCETCLDGYYGDLCTITKCHGTWNNDTACSGHGSCDVLDTCECYTNWYGLECSDFLLGWFCDGIFFNETGVCSGHGDCVFSQSCTCFPDLHFSGDFCGVCEYGYFGEDCDIPNCHGILGNNTEVRFDGKYVCGGNGVCKAPDDCECEGYIGDECGIPVCFDLEENDEYSCSGHGECGGNDDCGCDHDYYGPYCVENILIPEFTSDSLNELRVSYFLSRQEFLEAGKEEMTESSFNCSSIIQNWEEFLDLESSSCYFSFKEFLPGIIFSTELILEFDSTGVSDIHNFTIDFISVTKPEKIVSIQVASYTFTDDLGDGNEDNNNNNNNNPVEETDLTWLYVSLPSTFVLIIVGSSIILLVLICFLICCCCLICFVIGFIIFLCLCCGSGCSCLLLGQRKKLLKFNQLDNFDLLLKEQEIERNSTAPKIHIKKELFEIDGKKLKLLSILGTGGSSATVYKSDWNGRIVAFKCFKTRSICGVQSHFDEFEREANLLASISHPNIIQFFGCCLKHPRIGFLMEICENGDLSSYMTRLRKNKEVFLLEEKLRMFCEISTGMSYLHERKVIHRDLKMENVLLNSSLSCKIMDFGISRIFDQTQQKKTKNVGTSTYISPEMILGSIYNHKVDVFSFGILMWILYYEDEFPYGKNVNFVESKVAANPYFRPPFVENVKIPNWLKNLIISCLDHTPEKRKSFSDICEYIKENSKKEVKKEKEEEEEVGEEEEEENPPIFIFIKLKNQDRSKAERVFLMKRNFESLLRIVEGFYPKFEIKGLYLTEEDHDTEEKKIIPIKTDYDIREKLVTNCLIDVDVLEREENSKVEALEKEVQRLKKLLEEYQTPES